MPIETQPIGQRETPAKSSSPSPSLMRAIPLVIGITGHRDLRLEDRFALEEKVQSLFSDLRKSYPHTPLILLSPLAEGADRLVARVALTCGVGLVVPLPMAQEEYEKDFETQESRAEFADLLQKASQVFELPLAKGVRAADLSKDTASRALQYLQVGAFIVLHSQILIALWDGKPSDKVGGTAQITQFQLEGIPESVLHQMTEPALASLNILDPQENGPVYQVVTPRTSDPETDGEPLSARMLYPNGQAEQDA